MLIDPAVYRRYSRVIYRADDPACCLVVLVAEATRGSRRWIDIGFFRFQPSEFGKVLFTLFMAAFLADRAKRIDEFRTPLRALALAAVPITLVFIQPDIGTALVYTAVLAAVLLLSGVRWLHLAIIGSAALIGVLAVLWWLPATGVNVLKPYQAARLTGFTHPDSDPSGATYNVNQSITAVGAGGVRGRGVEGATQTSLDYLPEHATDFAFASLAEQRGFFGAAALLLLYLLVVWRGLKIVAGASDLFSAIVAGGHHRRARLPGVRQRRHDDRRRADHRHPAAVRLHRRLVDDDQPVGDGDPAGDPPPRPPAAGMSVAGLSGRSLLSLVREARGGAGDRRPLVVDGAPALVALLARELRAGGEPGAVREGGDPRGARAVVWIGTPDVKRLRAASLARVPIVGVSDGSSLPYVLDTDLVVVRPGEPVPTGAVARTVARVLADGGIGLAARLPVLRGPVVDELIRAASLQNAKFAAAVWIPGVDMPILTLNQARMVLRIAVAHGHEIGRERLADIAGVVGAGFGFRTVGRQLVGMVPFAGWAARGRHRLRRHARDRRGRPPPLRRLSLNPGSS